MEPPATATNAGAAQPAIRHSGKKTGALGGPRKEGRRFGSLSGRGWPTGDGTTPRRQPQLHYQLGETGGVWPSLETDARRKGGVGRGG